MNLAHPKRRWRYGIALVLLGLIAGGVFAGYRWFQKPRWNVLLITLDTTRADRIGCYGDSRTATPVIDGLAKRGVQFDRAYTTAPLTLPAHASLFTGLYPPEHGIHTNGKNRLDEEIPTLAEACRRRGYETGAFIASFVLDAKFGLKRGFETYDDDLTGTTPADEALHRNRDGRTVIDHALAWLSGRSQKPFFCWVHLYDPHSPYDDHADLFGETYRDRPYDAEIAYVDLQIGRLTDFLKAEKLEENTLVIIVGDHGEGLNDHGERRHGQMLYNSTLHVPWIMSLPGTLPAGQRVASPVSLVDFYPTMIETLGLRGSAKVSGRSLWESAQGKPLAMRPLYAASDEAWLEHGWSPLRSLITDEWKYIRTTKTELYQLADDMREAHNRAAEFPDKVAELEQQLTDLESGLRQRTSSKVQLSESEQQKLSGLGYLGQTTGSDRPATDANLRDIKDMIEHANTLEDAKSLLDAGKFDEATALLKALVAEAPDFELAELTLGDVSLRERRLEEAWNIYHRVVERNPESALAILHLGDVREAQGRYAEALEFYLEAVQREPDFDKLNYNIGRLLVVLQRDDEAISYFKKVLDLDPGYVFAHIELGSALARQGLLESALEHYELALKYDANSVFAHMNAASVLAQRGRADDALKHLEAAARIAPDDPEIRFQLGAFLVHQGRKSEAKTELEAVLRIQPAHEGAKQLLEQIRPRG